MDRISSSWEWKWVEQEPRQWEFTSWTNFPMRNAFQSRPTLDSKLLRRLGRIRVSGRNVEERMIWEESI
ncbi:unnamed protein product [Linum trigynum]|uniref:Uncharacterized protein n=1 Tax=Linum trigynum TaxID=586398 RepID=A0AAV2GN61_9ROSI